MFDINDDDVLSKTQIYEIDRTDGHLDIQVLENLANGDFKFLAIPRLSSEAPKKFWGRGDTELEALNDCLRLIKVAKIAGEIIPSLRADRSGDDRG